MKTSRGGAEVERAAQAGSMPTAGPDRSQSQDLSRNQESGT